MRTGRPFRIQQIEVFHRPHQEIVGTAKHRLTIKGYKGGTKHREQPPPLRSHPQEEEDMAPRFRLLTNKVFILFNKEHRILMDIKFHSLSNLELGPTKEDKPRSSRSKAHFSK